MAVGIESGHKPLHFGAEFSRKSGANAMHIVCESAQALRLTLAYK